jgi:hypothetical protein
VKKREKDENAEKIVYIIVILWAICLCNFLLSKILESFIINL